MTFLIFICLAAFLWLLWLLRRDRVSLGLPIAYLYSLLLIHVPGAFAHIAGRDFLLHSDLIELGMRFTALGSMCFVAGVWLARSSTPKMPDPPRGGSRSLLVVLLARRVVSHLRPQSPLPYPQYQRGS